MNSIKFNNDEKYYQMINVLDLFAGAGGLSEGFYNEGFNIVSHVELDKQACQTLRTREAFRFLKRVSLLDYYKYLEGKISRKELYDLIPNRDLDRVINEEISLKTLRSIFAKIDNQLSEEKRKTVDVIIGGPPCQAYSIVGRNRDPNRMANDPRNFLYRYYGKFLKYYKPKIFLFENVPGILSAGNGRRLNTIFNHFRESGYTIHHSSNFLLNATNFGVAQNRNRVILVGVRKDIKLKPSFEFNYNGTLKAEDLICHDLVKLGHNQGNLLRSEYIKEPNEYLTSSGIRNGEPFITQHYSRYTNENDREIYRIVATNLIKSNKKTRYEELPNHLIRHRNTKAFQNRFKAVNPKEPSQTIVAHMERDGHYYIHPDIEQNRSLTIREAARLQSFPDNYFFEGSRGAALRQIGNAVPPLMAKGLAKMIKEIFFNETP